jgi:hypothetical protein
MQAAASLAEILFTRRKKDAEEFDFGGGGKTACFAVILGNGGRKKPF